MPCVTKKAQWALNWINPHRVSQVKFFEDLKSPLKGAISELSQVTFPGEKET